MTQIRQTSSRFTDPIGHYVIAITSAQYLRPGLKHGMDSAMLAVLHTLTLH